MGYGDMGMGIEERRNNGMPTPGIADKEYEVPESGEINIHLDNLAAIVLS